MRIGKYHAILLSLLLILCFTATALAAEPPAVTGTEESAEAPQTQAAQPEREPPSEAEPPEATTPTIPAPLDVERKNLDGDEYLIKTFETAPDFDPALLVEDGYEDGGFLFAHLTTDKKPNENKSTKEVTETVQVATPLFSYLEEPGGTVPSAKLTNALTGKSSPLRAFMGCIIFFTYSGTPLLFAAVSSVKNLLQ